MSNRLLICCVSLYDIWHYWHHLLWNTPGSLYLYIYINVANRYMTFNTIYTSDPGKQLVHYMYRITHQISTLHDLKPSPFSSMCEKESIQALQSWWNVTSKTSQYLATAESKEYLLQPPPPTNTTPHPNKRIITFYYQHILWLMINNQTALVTKNTVTANFRYGIFLFHEQLLGHYTWSM